MINFDFSLNNPFSSRWNSGKCWNGKITKNKAWEVQVMKTPVIVGFEFRWTVQQDHAGVRLELGLFGHNVCAQLYDVRHWNDETNTWTVYG